MIMPEDRTADLERQIADFEAKNPQLTEAMRVFGISTAQYARAMVALTRVPTLTATSTDIASNDQA
jgi:hypothetical protein